MTKQSDDKSVSSVLSSDLKAQQEYAHKLATSGFDFTLTVAGAFVRGIRDIGYKHTGTALDELIDNGLQAEATKIHVVFGYERGLEKKPDSLAVIDNGHGMTAEMVRASVIWGGTHREGDRSGFGRYGYGLPSASVSQGRRFSVFSRTQGETWNKATVDVDDIGAGKYANAEGRIVIAPPVQTDLPEWVESYIKKHYKEGGLIHGTVVLVEKLDRLTWKTTQALERQLLEHFGVTYRNFLREVDLWVNEKKVEPTDPLFLTQGFRFYDLDEDRATARPPLNIEVKDREGVPHMVRLRFSYMPPTFQREEKAKERGKKNARFTIMKEHKGIIVLRNGRQIDIVDSGCPWKTFVNYDRNWGVEIDFPAGLDEEFSITTSKQQVRLSERMWDILAKEGVYAAIEKLCADFQRDLAVLKAKPEKDAAAKRASELAMEEAEKFIDKVASEEPPDRLNKSEEAFRREVDRRAEVSGVPSEEIKASLLLEVKERPYKVAIENMPGAPFYHVEQIGGQRVLYLNTAHRFYTDVYACPESTVRWRASLEVLLFVLGECELDATKDRRVFYMVERSEWSKRLSVALDRLEEIDSIDEVLGNSEEEKNENPSNSSEIAGSSHK